MVDISEGWPAFGIGFLIILSFMLFFMWISPDPNSKEEQMEMCMYENNNTKQCELEVKYGDWIRFSYH